MILHNKARLTNRSRRTASPPLNSSVRCSVRIFSNIRQAFRANALSGDPPISVSPTGFTISGHFVSWRDIQEISAYKIDLLTTDEVRFSLSISSKQDVTVSEEQTGFNEFVTSLVAAFPSVSGWQTQIVNPAFAPNYTVLYRRI